MTGGTTECFRDGELRFQTQKARESEEASTCPKTRQKREKIHGLNTKEVKSETTLSAQRTQTANRGGPVSAALTGRAALTVMWIHLVQTSLRLSSKKLGICCGLDMERSQILMCGRFGSQLVEGLRSDWIRGDNSLLHGWFIAQQATLVDGVWLEKAGH